MVQLPKTLLNRRKAMPIQNCCGIGDIAYKWTQAKVKTRQLSPEHKSAEIHFGQTRFDSIPTILWKAFTPYIHPAPPDGKAHKNTLKTRQGKGIISSPRHKPARPNAEAKSMSISTTLPPHANQTKNRDKARNHAGFTVQRVI